jgi:hypothetical protein
MAITINKAPAGIYPAYNDSYLVFESDLVDNFKAEIEIALLGGEIFTVYPEAGGEYVFNLLDIVKGLINADGFRNPDDTYPVGWLEAFPYGYLSLPVVIRTYNTTTNDTTSPTYTFIRGVKQIDEVIHSNPFQLLHRNTNGVDYNLTYFEGYPFSFEIARVDALDTVLFRNLNSSDVTAAVATVTTNTQRIWVDKGTENWTTTSYLPLTDTLNRLEIDVALVPAAGSTVTNLNLKKIPSKCGVYLRWFNHAGGYSYFLFDEFYRDQIKSRELGSISSNTFLNAPNHVAPSLSTGYSGRRTLTLRATVDANEAEHLRDLFTTPSVQMYNAFEAFQDANFIDVKVTTGYSYSNKKRLNEVKFTIELPELITPIL